MSAVANSLPPLARTVDPAPASPPTTVYPVLFAISLSHGLNDTLQALLPAIFPLLKSSLDLNFAQLGWIMFAFYATASVFQPLVGWITDRRPMPRSLAVGMALILVGLLALALAGSYPHVLGAAIVIGLGSAIFHPEASRVAFMAAGPRRGLAQSLFQLGGNAGSSLGALLAALVVAPHGQAHVAWFALVAVVGIGVLWPIGTWQRTHRERAARRLPAAGAANSGPTLSRARILTALGILIVLIFSKYVYMASMTNYYAFYLIHRFGSPVQSAQLALFVFLGSVALGTIIGGPLGDRIGRRRVIWGSILGVAPFSLALPHVGLTGTIVLTVFTGAILASAFSAIVVYAQELLPGKVGMIAGLFFGLAFGIAGMSAAGLGKLADLTSIETVFQVCAYLPLLGLLAVFLPDVGRTEKPK